MASFQEKSEDSQWEKADKHKRVHGLQGFETYSLQNKNAPNYFRETKFDIYDDTFTYPYHYYHRDKA